MSTALFIGRFQPFHKGHLDVVRKALATNHHLIIAIGSSQKSGTPENPYPATQRQQFIQAALQEAQIPPEKYTIALIPDINDNKKWVAHLNKLIPPYQKVYTGAPIVKECFTLANSPAEIIHVKRDLPIHATKIREKMAKGNSSWENDLPNSVAELIKHSQ